MVPFLRNGSIGMPKVSVIVPNYNHAAYLRRRVDSVLGQTFHDVEVILLDDASTDDSRAVLSSYGTDRRVRIEYNYENSGSAFKQWNKGVRMARGDYVWIAESDDYADERLLERLVAVLEYEHEAGFAYCRSWRVNASGEVQGYGDYYLSDLDGQRWAEDHCVDGAEACRGTFLFHNIVPNASAVLFRKGAYEEVGGSDESYQMCGDWKLWAAMALRGKIAYLAEPLNYFRFHEHNVRGRDAGKGMIAEESLRVIAWLMTQVETDENFRRKLSDTLSELWISAVLRRSTPLALKAKILHNARMIDAHAVRRLLRPAWKAARMKASLMWREKFGHVRES
jgi:hypothetical protein